MSNPKSASADPSMDDILVSIRNIISDDEARAQVDQARAGREDVLLLTDVIEEPQSTAKSTHAADASQPSLGASSDALLVGPVAAAAATQALARLSQAVLASLPVPAAPDPGPAVTSGGKTMEDLIKETLRPMLKDWLDRNLPAIVERYVEREVVRLTRR